MKSGRDGSSWMRGRATSCTARRPRVSCPLGVRTAGASHGVAVTLPLRRTTIPEQSDAARTIRRDSASSESESTRDGRGPRSCCRVPPPVEAAARQGADRVVCGHAGDRVCPRFAMSAGNDDLVIVVALTVERRASGQQLGELRFRAVCEPRADEAACSRESHVISTMSQMRTQNSRMSDAVAGQQPVPAFPRAPPRREVPLRGARVARGKRGAVRALGPVRASLGQPARALANALMPDSGPLPIAPFQLVEAARPLASAPHILDRARPAGTCRSGTVAGATVRMFTSGAEGRPRRRAQRVPMHLGSGVPLQFQRRGHVRA